LFEYGGVKISWLGHDGFRIKNAKTIYIDPYEIKGGEKANILLISHDHFDHCSPEDITKIISQETIIITTEESKRRLSKIKAKEIRVTKPGEKIIVDGISIEAVPAYNVNKFRSPGQPFHPKQTEMVGFIITVNGVRIYHAGDTDMIPEMDRFKVDIACIPISGTYVMTAEEAAESTKHIKPKIAIPMHYGAIVGDKADAEKFKRLASCEVQILSEE